MFVILKKKNTLIFFFSMDVNVDYICHTVICYYFLVTDSGFRTQCSESTSQLMYYLLVYLFTLEEIGISGCYKISSLLETMQYASIIALFQYIE